MLLSRQVPRAAALTWCWRSRRAGAAAANAAGGAAAAAAASSASAASPLPASGPRSGPAAEQQQQQQQKQQQPQQQRNFTTRDYPQEPRVGVGAVVFRRRRSPRPEILLIRRAKEPCRGEWCFAGGSLELGETVAQCAAREVEEETGIRLAGAADALATERRGGGGGGSGGGGSGGGGGGGDPDLGVGADAEADARLDRPTPFAVVDSIVYPKGPAGDEDPAAPLSAKPQFHFAIVEVAAVAEDGDAPVVASDDADAAGWFALDELRGLAGLTRGCAALAEQAARRFRVRGEEGA